MLKQELPNQSDGLSRYSGHGLKHEAVIAPAAGRFSHFVVDVTDLDRSEAWYRDVIGMDVLGRNLTAETQPHSLLQMNTGQLFILIQRDTVEPRRPGSSSIHHGLLLTPNQYRRAQERLKSYGYDIADTREDFRARGEYSMDVNDPDDHRYQIQAYGPEAHEIVLPGTGVVDCGPAERYKVGDVKLFKDGNFFLARMKEGFLAMSRWCTHMNGKVVYQKQHYRFWCPFHGMTYDRAGDPLWGRPDVCALRLNTITFSPEGHVLVNTDEVVQRERYEAAQAVPAPQPAVQEAVNG
ncbi:MAG TPA: VOC family protein [Chloroflexota bacterium]|nr:VOC family protein [Chloroflexota bacterium]